MPNHLEELVKEYYEYQLGNFVRTNVKFGKLKTGGYQGEADILALDMEKKILTHIECSIASLNDEELSKMAKKKFSLKDEEYMNLIKLPEGTKISRKFIINNTDKRRQDLMPDGVEHQTTREFLREIYNHIDSDLMRNAIPENYPILRGIQMIMWIL